jgi:hypothetical protein
VNSETVRVDHPQDAEMDSLSDPLPKLDRLVDGVRSLEQWYAADFDKRINALTAMLETQIRQELRAEFSAELTAQAEQLKQKYEESVYAQFGRWDLQRQALEKDIAELRKKAPDEELVAEIAATEKALKELAAKVSLELQQLDPDAASVSRMMQSRVEEMTLKAYLRGLKFRTEGK